MFQPPSIRQHHTYEESVFTSSGLSLDITEVPWQYMAQHFHAYMQYTRLAAQHRCGPSRL